MPRPSTVATGLGVFLLVGLIAVFFFLRYLVRKSFPRVDGSITIAGLHSPVDVVRDFYGVPHIRGNDDHDLMLATGYVHAQDRLWQMDLLRRAGEGRLSEVLGSSTISFDRLFRTLNLRELAETIVVHLHPESRRLLEDYSEGVNDFIRSHKGSYPIEFDMLNYDPEPWKPEHSIIAARLIAWELNLSWWTDLAYGEIAGRVSPERLQEIIPAYPDSLPPAVPSALMRKSVTGLAPLLDITRSYRSMFGLGSLEAGSNAWVVDSSRSLSGRPILANDPHLAMPAPSRWYILHLSAPGWNVAGVSLPGIPVVVIGHTPHHAWGLTNAMIDDADFFIEHPDSLDPKKYRLGRSSIPFVEREEKILVRDADSVVFTARSTRHGPVVSDIHPTVSRQGADTTDPRPIVSMQWTGFEISDEVYGFYLMNTATGPESFELGAKEISVPGQAVVYADTNNTIAYWATGKIPIRGKQLPLLPLDGWSGENEWRGFVPFTQMPKLANPPDGFIASANQKLADRNFPHYISTLWEPPSRAVRIRELLRSAKYFGADDFKQFQQDVVSPYARDVTRHLLEAFRDSSEQTADVPAALNYLRNWDYRFTSADIATSIFNAFFVRLIRNIYEDEMGESTFRDFVYFGAIPYRVTGQLLAADTSAWFDNIRTTQQERKDDVLRLSLREGLNDLRDTLGGEMKNWRWGELHTVTFRHPFGARAPLGPVFNIGPYPIGGGGTTVNKTEYKFTMPYSVSVGPSMRQIVDLSEPESGFIVIPSGQSGQPLHSHYDDQTALWLNGGYLTLTLNWDDLRRQAGSHLVLTPD